MAFSNGSELCRLEAACDELETLTDDGNEELDLEGIAPEDVKQLLIAMVNAAENLNMVVQRTMLELELRPRQPAEVGA